MAEKCNDPEGCKEDSYCKGLCKKHYQRQAYRAKVAKNGGTPPAQKPPRQPRAPRQLDLVQPEAALPPVQQLPNSYLLAAVQELVRRRNELVAATRELGLADPEAA